MLLRPAPSCIRSSPSSATLTKTLPDLPASPNCEKPLKTTFDSTSVEPPCTVIAAMTSLELPSSRSGVIVAPFSERIVTFFVTSREHPSWQSRSTTSSASLVTKPIAWASVRKLTVVSSCTSLTSAAASGTSPNPHLRSPVPSSTTPSKMSFPALTNRLAQAFAVVMSTDAVPNVVPSADPACETL